MTPNDHDERWDQLALGHVLGGLPDVDASAFRGHLVGCAQCRARVAELRSMASDLAAAEREERATQRLRTQIESRHEREPPVADEDASVWRRRGVFAGAVLVVLFVIGLSVWTAHLRSENASLRVIAETHARTLTNLGAGTTVPVATSGTVTGVVGVHQDTVAYSLAGLPDLEAGERLVVWLEVDGDVVAEDVYLPGLLDREQGRLAASIDAAGASRLLVTVERISTTFERDVTPDEPGPRVVVEADLNSVQPDAGSEADADAPSGG